MDDYLKKGKNSLFYRNTVKLITGFREPKNRGNIYWAGPWRLEGILLNLDKKFGPFQQKQTFDAFPTNVPNLPG